MSNIKKKESKESKVKKYMKAPIRILIKARDFYIRSMSECSDRVGYGTALGCPTGQVNTLPRSFSVSSTKSSKNDEDYRELMRAASTRSTFGNKFESDSLRRQQVIRQSPSNKMPRSYTVAIGRIDEDKPYDFGEDTKVEVDVLPRSRSYAVSRRAAF